MMASACIQCWALLLGGYDYTIEYKPAEHHANADFLSCWPLSVLPRNIPIPPESIALIESVDTSPVTSAEIKQWTAKDPLLSKVMDLVLHGRPQGSEEMVSPYHQYWNELSVHNGCLLQGNRVVVPTTERNACYTKVTQGIIE